MEIKLLTKRATSRVPYFMAAMLLFALLVQSFVPRELSGPFIVLMGLLVWAIKMGRQDVDFVKMTWPLLVLFVIGLHGVVNHESRHILRDIVFAIFPISLLFMGYWMAGHQRIPTLIFFKVLMFGGFLLAIYHLSAFIQSPELLFENVEDVRETAGKGTGGVVLVGLLLAIFQRRFQLGDIYLKFLPRYIVIPVLLGSFILSYSRTEFLIFFIGCLVLSGLVMKIRVKTILVSMVIAVVAVMIVIVTPEDETGTVRSKFVRSITEMTVADDMDEETINNNWRAYETIRAMESFDSGAIWEKVFGQGFGALVDIGLEIKLGDSFLSEIPIFHSGYVYVLIKTGIVGFACYVLFYLSLIRFAVRRGNSINVEERFFSRLLLGSVLGSMLMMAVIGGMAETAGVVFILLIGYSVRRLEYFQSQSPQNFRGKFILKTDERIGGAMPQRSFFDGRK